MNEDPNSERIGYCLHATGYFCHPGYQGMILSSVLECQKFAEDSGLKMLLARRQREGMKVSAGNVTQCVQLMLDFVSHQADAWTMRFGSNELTNTDPVHYWVSYITNPFIGLPDITTRQWTLYKCCMMELFGMWITTASLERAFCMGKQLAPPQKSRLEVSTTTSQLIIKLL